MILIFPNGIEFVLRSYRAALTAKRDEAREVE